MGGICASGYKEDKEAAEANRKINQILSKERRLLDDEFKLLLLGYSSSFSSLIYFFFLFFFLFLFLFLFLFFIFFVFCCYFFVLNF